MLSDFRINDPSFGVTDQLITTSTAETQTVSIVFTPSGAGPINSKLTFKSNDPNFELVEVNLSGTGIALPLATIVVDPLEIRFSPVGAGSPDTTHLDVSNVGQAVLTLSQVVSNNPAIQVPNSFPLSVNPGGAKQIDVILTGVEQNLETDLVIHSNASNRPQFSIPIQVTLGSPDMPVAHTLNSPDLDEDGQISFSDYIFLAGILGGERDDLKIDFNANGQTDFEDVVIFLHNFGRSLDFGNNEPVIFSRGTDPGLNTNALPVFEFKGNLGSPSESSGSIFFADIFVKQMSSPIKAVEVVFDFDPAILRVSNLQPRENVFSFISDSSITLVDLTGFEVDENGYLGSVEFTSLTDISGLSTTVGLKRMVLADVNGAFNELDVSGIQIALSEMSGTLVLDLNSDQGDQGVRSERFEIEPNTDTTTDPFGSISSDITIDIVLLSQLRGNGLRIILDYDASQLRWVFNPFAFLFGGTTVQEITPGKIQFNFDAPDGAVPSGSLGTAQFRLVRNFQGTTQVKITSATLLRTEGDIQLSVKPPDAVATLLINSNLPSKDLIDLDADGLLGLTDLLAFAQNFRNPPLLGSAVIDDKYRVFDLDKSGLITPDDIGLFFTNFEKTASDIAPLPPISDKVIGENTGIALDFEPSGNSNQTKDHVTMGTVDGAGSKIVVEVFIEGLIETLLGGEVVFDVDTTLVKLTEVQFPDLEPSSYLPSILRMTPRAMTFSGYELFGEGIVFRERAFTAIFTTQTDVTNQEFTIGIERFLVADAATFEAYLLPNNSRLIFNRNTTTGGDGDQVVLPTGPVGPIALDLDDSFGDQVQRQTTSNPSIGEQIIIDVAVLSGALGQQGFQLIFAFDANQLEFVDFVQKDIFATAIILNPEIDTGKITVSGAILGPTSTKDTGTIGQVIFRILDDFTGQTSVELTGASFNTPVEIGSGGSFVVIGGVQAPLVPSDPLEASDLNGDGIVNFPDFLAFAQGFGKGSEDAQFNGRLDLNSDGMVNFPDFLVFAQSFGKSVGG